MEIPGNPPPLFFLGVRQPCQQDLPRFLLCFPLGNVDRDPSYQHRGSVFVRDRKFHRFVVPRLAPGRTGFLRGQCVAGLDDVLILCPQPFRGLRPVFLIRRSQRTIPAPARSVSQSRGCVYITSVEVFEKCDSREVIHKKGEARFARAQGIPHAVNLRSIASRECGATVGRRNVRLHPRTFPWRGQSGPRSKLGFPRHFPVVEALVLYRTTIAPAPDVQN